MDLKSTVQRNTELMLNRRGCVVIFNHHDDYVVAQNNDNYYLTYFIWNVKCTIDGIRNIIAVAKNLDKNITNIIIIHAKSLTPDARCFVSITSKFFFELFYVHEMEYDLIEIIQNIAPHELLNDKPKEWKKYPCLLANTDRVCRYYNFKKDDIIKITENGVITYRRVV
jgi:hypothetical protein